MKYIIVFLRKHEKTKTFQEIERKTMKKLKETISINDKTFPLTEKMVSISLKKHKFMFIDFDTEKVIKVFNSDIGISAKFLDMLISKKIVLQLVKSVKESTESPDKFTIAKYVVPFILGFIIGILFTVNPSALL